MSANLTRNYAQIPRLYVEGKDDEHVVVQLLMRHDYFAHAHHGPELKPGNEENVDIVVEWVSANDDESGGKGKLLGRLSQSIRTPKSDAIGFIIDADDPEFTEWSRERTWESVRTRLAIAPASIETPPTIESVGFVGTHAGTGTAIGVWLMPDNVRDGAIEDFLQDLVDSQDALMTHAKASTETAVEIDRRSPQKDRKKAEIHAWLAWQSKPGMPYGTAINVKSFQHDTEIALQFIEWIKRLIPPRSTP